MLSPSALASLADGVEDELVVAHPSRRFLNGPPGFGIFLSERALISNCKLAIRDIHQLFEDVVVGPCCRCDGLFKQVVTPSLMLSLASSLG